MSRDATSVWSGYTHQGNMGLVVALAEIERLTNGSDEVGLLDNWSIHFENAEDFDICDGSDLAWSRHQVKARKNFTRQSQYSSVLKDNEEGVPGYDSSGVRQGECYLHTINEVTSWADSGDINPYGIKLYNYPGINQNHCSFSEPGDDNSLYDIYHPLLSKISGKDIDDRGGLTLLWGQLQAMLDEKLHQCHYEGVTPEISFAYLYRYIKDDNPYIEATHHRLKKLISKEWDRYDQARLESGYEVTPSHLRAKNSLDALCHLPPSEFLRAINIMHPTNTGSDANLNTTGVKEVAFKALLGIEKNINASDMSYQAETPYILTTIFEIDDRAKPVVARDISNQIITNPNITQELFKKSNLINHSFEGQLHEFLKGAITTPPVHDKGLLAGKEVEDIMDPADIRFVTVETAVNELGGNE